MQDEYDMIKVRGKPRYRKNRKIVSKNTLPREIMERFGLLGEETPKDQGIALTDKSCIFCGIHSRFTRYVQGQTVYVCDNDYYDKGIGKIAQRLREIEDEKEARNEKTT